MIRIRQLKMKGSRVFLRASDLRESKEKRIYCAFENVFSLYSEMVAKTFL